MGPRMLRMYLFVVFFVGFSLVIKILYSSNSSNRDINIELKIKRIVTSNSTSTPTRVYKSVIYLADDADDEIDGLRNSSFWITDKNLSIYTTESSKYKHIFFNDEENKDNKEVAKLLFGKSFVDREEKVHKGNKQSVIYYNNKVQKASYPTTPVSPNVAASPLMNVFDTPHDSNEIEVYGSLNDSMNYAVFSTTTDSRNSISFIFYLPFTALAWRRVGFGSIVIIVGSSTIWNGDPLLSFVYDQLTKLDCVLIFINTRAERETMLSQVSRIYAGNILHFRHSSAGNAYLVTSDADLWPMHGEDFTLPQDKSILSLNSECCAPFKHRERVYRMLPLSNVGMRVKHWHEVTNHFGESPHSIDGILTQVVREFGSVALRPIRKSENIGWYLDQMLISILVAKWNDLNPNEVKYTSRDTSWDRVDRNNWLVSQTIEDKVDAHLPADGYKPEVWNRIIPLVTLMYGKHSSHFRYCQYYYTEFTKILSENGVP